MSVSKTETVDAFLEEKISRLAREAEPLNCQRGDLIPPEIRPAAGEIKLAAFLSLMIHCGLGGSRWCRKFLFGFELVGVLCQSGTSPVDPRANDLRPLAGRKISSSAHSRFRERPAASGRKNAELLRKEYLGQQAKGWLPRPVLIDLDASRPASPINYASLFGVSKGEMLRARDDMDPSPAKLSCIVRTPIKLASWGHVAELCRRVASSRSDWRFFKADREAAYKQIPLKWEQSRLAAVTPRCPTGGKWYSFRIRTLVFGAVAALLRYNVFSMAMAELFAKIPGSPI